MKKILIFIFSVFVLVSCSPDEFPPLGDRADRVSQLTGTWSLTQVTQEDQDAVRKGFPFFAQVQNITNAFPYTSITLSLNTDNTFTLDNGNAPNILGGLSSGTWAVDDQLFPSTLIFTSGSDSFELSIGSFAEIGDGVITLKKARMEERDGSLNSVLEYNYEFSK
mgnify:CR=1 FL=1